MKLNTIITGERGDLPPVILAHGLFGQARNLGGLARRLDDARQVISVDMRNHGDSPQSDDHSYPAMAEDLAELIEAQGGSADLVGHSMGGKAAMVLALTRPELVRRLVVLDIAPIAYTHSQQPYADAMQGLELDGLTRRSEADKRLAETLDDPGVRAFLLQNLDLKADPPIWKLNLDVLSEQMPIVTGWPEGLTKAAFEGPALFLAGGASDYAAEGPAADAIRAYFPQAELRYLDGCGHWIHAENPKQTGEAVAEFLS
ncbi:alpha/beta fold hydrolase [Paracoccus sediminicola]|uniref:alpha/beta fold hydrolase n=1 Tax=Paracoccus sediminicola TaxID=3017783 RepID=UPI0022F0D235|nr:alpha/beta fold hydrolase [Paracoccus sediminicola]WBU57550.1 alpha/beta fold hydrolase [Paracoccus sediminicola]